MLTKKHVITVAKLAGESLFFYLLAALFDDIKAFIPNVFAKVSLPHTQYLYGIIGIIAIAGASILGYHLVSLLHRNLKTKKESTTSLSKDIESGHERKIRPTRSGLKHLLTFGIASSGHIPRVGLVIVPTLRLGTWSVNTFMQ